MKTLRHTLSLAVLLSCHAAVADEVDVSEDAAKVVELKVVIPVNAQVRGKATEPRAATSADELAKLVKDEKARKAIAEQVDFAKQDVLLFTWAGSGQDKLAAKIEKGETTKVVFSYRRGLTRDLRPHLHVFAIPKGAKYSVETARGR